MNPYVYYEYYNYNDADFFTLILNPDKVGKFPVVVTRSPYVSYAKDLKEEELAEIFMKENLAWAENNYVLVFQHCRGQGKSSGAFVPYIYEREDGLELRKWIRRQDFYNGQMFLLGGSYTASLHYSTAPFECDIKGAVFNVQDSERYRLWYRNGNMRRGHANWHFSLYKEKSNLNKVHTMDSFSEVPIKDLSERVLGERAEDFEQMLLAPSFEHPFWQTRNGGCEARDALKKANIPILLTTGYNDFYLGGMFKMWNEMDDETKEKCAMIVSPYNHGDKCYAGSGISFLKGSVAEKFGSDYRIRWFDSILNNEKQFVETGKVTYYRTFENTWKTDFYKDTIKEKIVPLDGGTKTILYNPENPTAFNAEGCFMDAPYKRDDIITVYTKPMDDNIFVRGKMKAKLTVSSDCEDTTFYVMVGIQTENGDFALRHDITSIIYQKKSYEINTEVCLEFEFDEYAFSIEKGQCLRIDIAPTDKNTYVCHTNIKGDYSEIETKKIAKNQVLLGKSFLILPTESDF